MTTLHSFLRPPFESPSGPFKSQASVWHVAGHEVQTLHISFKSTTRATLRRLNAHLDRVSNVIVENPNIAEAEADVDVGVQGRGGANPLKEMPLQSVRGAELLGAAAAAAISDHFWEWRHRWNVHYEAAGLENSAAPALLLLPGFGVGSFHYDQQLRDLGREYRVWAVDFLGQGKSWPSHDPAPEVLKIQGDARTLDWGFGDTPEPWAQELVYSVDTWRDQVHAFIDKVIGEPVYIVGNSLGGYVGAYVAATNPELVKGLALLNATPFWAFMPNARRYPLLSKLVPWGGLLPVPILAKSIIRVWWDFLRNPRTVKKMIELVYADRSVINDKLIRQMLEATDHPASFAAFASIVFAPRAHSDFGQNLISLNKSRTPMCMIYGKEDPWVVPFWGQRAKQRNPDAVYYELSPAGHCPHHEAPEVVNTLVRKWVESVQSQGALSPALLDSGMDPKECYWFVVENEGKRVSVRVKDTQGFWTNLVDSVREFFQSVRCSLKLWTLWKKSSLESLTRVLFPWQNSGANQCKRHLNSPKVVIALICTGFSNRTRFADEGDALISSCVVWLLKVFCAARRLHSQFLLLDVTTMKRFFIVAILGERLCPGSMASLFAD